MTGLPGIQLFLGSSTQSNVEPNGRIRVASDIGEKLMIHAVASNGHHDSNDCTRLHGLYDFFVRRDCLLMDRVSCARSDGESQSKIRLGFVAAIKISFLSRSFWAVRICHRLIRLQLRAELLYRSCVVTHSNNRNDATTILLHSPKDIAYLHIMYPSGSRCSGGLVSTIHKCVYSSSNIY